MSPKPDLKGDETQMKKTHNLSKGKESEKESGPNTSRLFFLHKRSKIL